MDGGRGEGGDWIDGAKEKKQVREREQGERERETIKERQLKRERSKEKKMSDHSWSDRVLITGLFDGQTQRGLRGKAIHHSIIARLGAGMRGEGLTGLVCTSKKKKLELFHTSL